MKPLFSSNLKGSKSHSRFHCNPESHLTGSIDDEKVQELIFVDFTARLLCCLFGHNSASGLPTNGFVKH